MRYLIGFLTIFGIIIAGFFVLFKKNFIDLNLDDNLSVPEARIATTTIALLISPVVRENMKSK